LRNILPKVFVIPNRVSKLVFYAIEQEKIVKQKIQKIANPLRGFTGGAISEYWSDGDWGDGVLEYWSIGWLVKNWMSVNKVSGVRCQVSGVRLCAASRSLRRAHSGRTLNHAKDVICRPEFRRVVTLAQRRRLRRVALYLFS
jgi:hypothetical protein